MHRFCGLIGDFIFPEDLKKSLLSEGMFENFKISFDLENEPTDSAWTCSTSDFTQFVRRQYPYLGTTIKLIFESFISAEPLPQPASMEQNHILSQELLHMLMVVNPKFQGIPKLHLMYSSKVHGQSFNKLVSNLVGWPSPALILLKCSYLDSNRESRVNVMGAMTFCQLLDKYGHYGSHNTVLFSLVPYFKIIKTKTGNRGSSYVYLNSTASGQK